MCARTAEAHELGGDGVERGVEGDDPHELFERGPEVAGRGVGCGPVRRGEDAFERDAAPLEHVDHVERLHEREGVGAHRRAERGALLVGGARHVDHELLGEGDARGGAGVVGGR